MIHQNKSILENILFKWTNHNKYQDIENKQEDHWEKRVNSSIYCITVASSGQLV